ncbi:MAG TPA: CDP-alcohol phosphatidyltransferase family protein [Candidatus Uhrbacteria bacterium]|nr:CDP-alcohol phosphatidyltransferase family protein [Candidatus Uhrbacteria bacterium]
MDAIKDGVLEKQKFPNAKPHDYFFLPVLKFIPQTIKPNHLSALRFLMALPLILLIWLHFYKLAALLFLFSALLDGLDGSMARLRGQETQLGTILDPTADKVSNAAVFLGFLFYVKSDVYLSLILPILIIDLVLFQTALLKYLIKNFWAAKQNWLTRHIEIKKTGANAWGKTKMVLQIIVLSMLLLFDPETSIKLHEQYAFLPETLTLVEISLPLLLACIFFGAMSLKGHLREIAFKN